MNRRVALAAALITVGVLCTLSPLVLFEFHGERRAVAFDRRVDEPVDDSTVVKLGELPADTVSNLPNYEPPSLPGAGDTVGEAYGGFTPVEWEDADELRSHEYLALPTDTTDGKGPVVRTVNRTYTVTPQYLGATSDALYTLALGPVALALGVLLGRTDSAFPLNQSYAAALAASGFAGFLAYRAIVGGSLGDSRYNGSIEVVLLDGVGGVTLAAGVAMGLVAGAGAARGKRRIPAALVLCSLLLPGVTGLGVVGLVPGAFVGFLAGAVY